MIQNLTSINSLLFPIYHYSIKAYFLERAEIVFAFAAAWFALFIAVLAFIHLKGRKSHKTSKSELKNSVMLMNTFIDANDSLIYLKDENLNYVFANRAFQEFYQKSAEDIVGHNDYELSESAFADKRRKTDLDVLEKQILLTEDVEWDDKVYRSTKFPVKMTNGKYGVGAYIKDITEEHNLLKRQEKIIYRHTILAEVISRSFETRQEQLDYVLHKSLKLTDSKYGYIYLYDEQTKEFTLNSWTNGVMADCAITDQQTKYQLEKTGIWGEVVRQRKPIILNEFQCPHPLKKGYPAGHVALTTFMSIPVIIDEKIVAVVGLANNPDGYDENDIYEMTLLMSGVWQAVERREAEENLAYERNKYRQTLVSIGDGVMVVDQNKNIEMLNDVAQTLTGWSMEEALGRYYKEVFMLSHEDPKQTIHDPIEDVFATNQIHELGNHAVLTSKNGIQYSLEDSAAPIKDEGGKTVGVVLVFRDVTEKKEQRSKIEYLSFHDSLTGLYNRRFFEEELHRLDEKENLPISIIMGDVNGLKLTNDIFGHAFGDILLKRFSEVLGRICRQNDIAARWGGDEFVILLPKTNHDEAEQIMSSIKNEFSKEQINSFKGSISMGIDTKQKVSENIVNVLSRAEERMYSAKALDRDEFKNSAIQMIIQTLHKVSKDEKDHSIRVSNLCVQLGKAANLTELQLKKLKDAGYLHDIGKVVLDPKLLGKTHLLNQEEWNEVKSHPIVGYRILNSFDETVDLAETVLAHHELWDGSGYPKGLKEAEIPILARIISLAENYDRMTHDSDNLEFISDEDAINFIRENAGTKFDPELASKFISILKLESKE